MLAIVVLDILLGFFEMRKSDNRFDDEVKALQQLDKPVSPSSFAYLL